MRSAALALAQANRLAGEAIPATLHKESGE